MAKAIAEQIRKAMIAEAKRSGSNLTTESINAAIQRILSSRSYGASSSGDGITRID
jgi:hypothetical protein